MPIDFNALMDDPQFVAGLGMLGGASPRNAPMLQAFQMIQAVKKRKADEEEQKSQSAYRNAQIEVAKANASRYGEQNELARAKLEQAAANRKFFEQIMRGQFGGEEQPPMQSPIQQQPPQPQQQMPQPAGPIQPPQALGAIGPTNAGERTMQTQFPSPTNQSERGMLRDMSEKYGPDPKALTREILATQVDLTRVQDPNSVAQLQSHLANLRQQQANMNKRVLSGSPEKQAQVATQPAQPKQKYVPEFKFGADGDMDVTLKPDYEQQRIDLTKDEFGLKKRESERQDAELALKQAKEAAETRRIEAAAAETAQKMTAAQGKAYQSHQSLDLALDTMSETVNRLKKHPGLDSITGLTSYLHPALLGEKGRNAAAEMNHLKGQVFTNASQAFRRMNETGGSVGQQSDWEGKQFIDSWGRLDQAQSPKEFKKALDDLNVFLAESKLRMKATYDYYQGKNKGEVPPEKFKRVVRVGKQGTRKVVQFEDGSTDFAD